MTKYTVSGNAILAEAGGDLSMNLKLTPVVEPPPEPARPLPYGLTGTSIGKFVADPSSAERLRDQFVAELGLTGTVSMGSNTTRVGDSFIAVPTRYFVPTVDTMGRIYWEHNGQGSRHSQIRIGRASNPGYVRQGRYAVHWVQVYNQFPVDPSQRDAWVNMCQFYGNTDRGQRNIVAVFSKDGKLELAVARNGLGDFKSGQSAYLVSGVEQEFCLTVDLSNGGSAEVLYKRESGSWVSLGWYDGDIGLGTPLGNEDEYAVVSVGPYTSHPVNVALSYINVIELD